MSDDQDQPESESWGLVVPFIVCQSKGGPYEDESFVAGFQCGEIDKALATAQIAGATRVEYTVRTGLVPQLELVAMNRGFPIVEAREVTETEHWSAMPDWSFVAFATTHARRDEP